MTTFSWVDVLRSIVIGQAVILAVLIYVHFSLLIFLAKPRPGRLIGAAFRGFSFFLFVVYAMNDVFMDISKVWDLPTIIVITAVPFGSLGMILLIANLIFNNSLMKERLTRWFGPY